MADGSVVGSPFASQPTPNGTARPSRAASSRSPCDITLDDWSHTIGGWGPRGHAKATAFVPVIGLAPPQAAIRFFELTHVNATSPCSANGSTSGHNAAKWWELRVSR